jgi:very-short-patch-repair endonuclease
MNRRKSKYDWSKIQKFCDEKSRTVAEVSKKFGFTTSAVYYAIKDSRLRPDSVMKLSLNKNLNWAEIQKDFDNKLSWRFISKKWGCSMGAIKNARDRGELKTMSKSEAQSLARKTHPESFVRSEKTREKISKSMKKFMIENPDMVPYKRNHKSKGPSYPERYFSELFEKEGLKLERYYRFFTYELDFADPVLKIDIEIDGDQHKLDKRIVKHDEKRNKFLKDRGWKVFRILWSDYVKLDFDDRKDFVKTFIKSLGL